jgi:hypothetical protein
MAKDYGKLWKDVTATAGEGEAVRILVEILLEKEGRAFISHLERKKAELCIEILDHVGSRSGSVVYHLRWFHQAIAGGNLKPAQKQAFFVTLRRLAGIHGRLPESMVIREKVEVGEEILVSGGFSDIRCGTYKGYPVAVKPLRIAKTDDLMKIRKVRVNVGVVSTNWWIG